MKTLNKAMIIDDDELDNYICSRIIRYSGFAKNTVYFTDGEEALAHLLKVIKENPDDLPEIIFLDLSMPGTDGWAFLEEYEKLDSDYKERIYLSILTSSVFKRDINKAKGFSDVDTYLSKPLSTDKLNRINHDINDSRRTVKMNGHTVRRNGFRV